MEQISGLVSIRHPLAFHKAIYAAIYQRKPEEARRRMSEHLIETSSLLASAGAERSGFQLTERITAIARESKPRKVGLKKQKVSSASAE